jgi:pilus assembly protein CpaB
MRAKTILTLLFLISLGVAAIVVLRALPHASESPAQAAANRPQILVAAIRLDPGTLLRDQDVTWAPINRAPEPSEFERPSAAALQEKPELDQQAIAAVYGAALRGAISGAAARLPIAEGEPIRRNEIVKPGDRDFLQVVLSPGARAIAIPVATGGASTGLLYPGDRVDVVLTQQFANNDTPLTRRSVSETVVENLRVLAIDAPDAKVPSGEGPFGRTVTLEVTPMQAEDINVATDLGKLSLTLRSEDTRKSIEAAAAPGPGATDGIKPAWAGDVSPALGGIMPPAAVITAEQPPVTILHGVASQTIRPTAAQ